MGNLTFVWVGWERLNRKVPNDLFLFIYLFFFFFLAPKSLTAINTCLDKMEEFKERNIAIS